MSKLDHARWILERNLGWIAAAEAKAAVIVAIDIAMLGGLSAAVSGLEVADRTTWARLFTFLSFPLLISSLACIALSILPRVEGPPKSFIFFVRVAGREPQQYREEFSTADESQLLADCIDQIHRNAEIAREKFSWIRCAMWWSFLSIVPWTLAIALLVRV